MTNERKQSVKKLPFIQMAAFCGHVVEGQESKMSAIDIFDRITLHSPPPEAKAVMALKVLLCLKSGPLKGKRTIKFQWIDPKGKKITSPVPLPEPTVDFKGNEVGVNIVMHAPIQIEHDGLYWLDVAIGDTTITQMPLRVDFEKPESKPKKK